MIKAHSTGPPAVSSRRVFIVKIFRGGGGRRPFAVPRPPLTIVISRLER